MRVDALTVSSAMGGGSSALGSFWEEFLWSFYGVFDRFLCFFFQFFVRFSKVLLWFSRYFDRFGRVLPLISLGSLGFYMDFLGFFYSVFLDICRGLDGFSMACGCLARKLGFCPQTS